MVKSAQADIYFKFLLSNQKLSAGEVGGGGGVVAARRDRPEWCCAAALIGVPSITLPH